MNVKNFQYHKSEIASEGNLVNFDPTQIVVLVADLGAIILHTNI